jgi:hypothetical protein
VADADGWKRPEACPVLVARPWGLCLGGIASAAVLRAQIIDPGGVEVIGTPDGRAIATWVPSRPSI